MVESGRGLSIGSYALIMVGLVLLAFLSYGAFTYTEFQRVRADMEATSRAEAKDEVTRVMAHILEEAESLADRFAEWEEVNQQLQVPRYYPYWRSHRMTHSNVLPDFVTDAEIYDREGDALAQLGDSSLPNQLGRPPPPSYVEMSGGEPSLLVFRTLYAPGDAERRQPYGYAGLRVRFLKQMRESYAYRYVDAQSHRFRARSGIDPQLGGTEVGGSVHAA